VVCQMASWGGLNANKGRGAPFCSFIHEGRGGKHRGTSRREDFFADGDQAPSPHWTTRMTKGPSSIDHSLRSRAVLYGKDVQHCKATLIDLPGFAS